ncbi:MAG: positive regulator of sigma E activity, partial [Polaribacter sp.]
MPRWIFPLIIITLLIIAVEVYTFQAFKTISKSKITRFLFLAISMVVYLYSFIIIFSYDRSNGQTPQFQMAMGLLLTVSIPKLFV